MRRHSDVKHKMPFLDTFKTAAAVGLLMQHTMAMYCQDVPNVKQAPCTYLSVADEYESSLKLKEALGVISDLTSTLSKAYFMLANADSEDARTQIIETLDQEKSDLIELHLRGLEGAIKNIYKECPDELKGVVKPVLVTTAQARSAASRLNDLIGQMLKPVETFASSIDMDGLRALAKHGTATFISGQFH
ncbi:hypothetical protein [Escherichia coli]|uniref:hypothetical protein n=1 Tax=Escherichia coli TaxID=562 RepID=UPI0029CA5D9F|nr:hypothetical protein [Escherichia coli]